MGLTSDGTNGDAFSRSTNPTIDLDCDDFTLMFWGQYNDALGNSWVVNIGRDVGGNRFLIHWGFGTDNIEADHGSQSNRITNGTIPTNRWVHTTWNASIADSDQRLFEDGSLITGPTTLSEPASTQAGIDFFDNPDRGGDENWAGDLYCFVFTKTELTDNQIGGIGRGIHPFALGVVWEFLYPMLDDADPQPDWSGNGYTLARGATNGFSKSTTNPPMELIENYL